MVPPGAIRWPIGPCSFCISKPQKAPRETKSKGLQPSGKLTGNQTAAEVHFSVSKSTAPGRLPECVWTIIFKGETTEYFVLTTSFAKLSLRYERSYKTYRR